MDPAVERLTRVVAPPSGPPAVNEYHDLVGLTDGEYLYRVVRPDAAPDTWTVLISEGRGPGREHHPTGCGRFLLDRLTGEVRSTILPSGHPTTPHAFPVPMEYERSVTDDRASAGGTSS